MSRRKPAAVSLEVELYELSKARAKALGFPTWSAYIVQLIRRDLHAGGSMTVMEEGAAYRVEKKPGPVGDAPSPPEALRHARF